MAVEFISRGYDTTLDKPYGESVWADAFPVIGTARYGVRSPLDWKVTAVAGQDRTVSINAGRGFGHGVTDKTVENDTLQLATISSGSRWDLIVARRDWTPTAGVTKFEKVAGGATATIPGGRLVGPGNIDDQPLALVQVTAGQTQPTAIIDLRTWSGDGGGLIANHDLVRSFMDTTGTRLNINGVDWVRRVGANDTPEWYTPVNKGTTYTALWSGATNWGAGGYMTGTYWLDGDLVTVRAKVQSGTGASLGTGVIGFSLPTGYPIAAGTTLGTAVLSSNGILRTLTAVASGATGCSVWAPTNPISTPGTAGYPFGPGDFFEALITYQTSAT